jgi:hypothetical protein
VTTRVNRLELGFWLLVLTLAAIFTLAYLTSHYPDPGLRLSSSMPLTGRM